MKNDINFERALDFPLLISKNPNLAQYYNRRLNEYDFGSNNAIIELTQTLFETKLGLKVRIDGSRLCPRFFNRLDYVLFIRDLLQSTSSAEALLDEQEHQPQYIGIDVGCGQIAVYGLMCASVIENLKQMLCTDIDEKSIITATESIVANKLNGKVAVQHVDPGENSFGPFAELLSGTNDREVAAFSMCNPPFYSSRTEMSMKNSLKRQKTNSNGEYVTGADNELLTSGGELTFIRKLVQDSKSMPNNRSVKWFTSLAGNYQTVRTLIKEDFARDPDFNFGVHSFKSGYSRNATKRWIVYWSFGLIRPPVSVSSVDLAASRYKLTINCDTSVQITEADLNRLNDIKCKNPSGRVLLAYFPGDRWSRAYRRSLKHAARASQPDEECCFKIVSSGNTVTVYWLYGAQRRIFESFCGFMTRVVRKKETKCAVKASSSSPAGSNARRRPA